MRKIIETLLALAFAALANSAHAEFRWQHFGADPYAPTREAATKMRETAFPKLGLPAEAVAAAMQATAKPGEPTKLTNGDRLGAMIFRGNIVHRDVLVAFVKPPQSGMEFAAKAERWVVTSGGKIYTILLPEVCNNWSVTIAPAPVAIRQPPALATIAAYAPAKPIVACPDVYHLKVNVWEHAALKLPGVQDTANKEEFGQGNFSGAVHVSSKHGGQFRRAHAVGELKRSDTERAFRVSLFMTPEASSGSSEITREEVLGDIVVTGLRELQFTRAQLETWDAIRVIAVNGDVVSPPRFSGTGLKELRFFNRLPGKNLGEWNTNPVPDCVMNVHWVE